MADDSAREKKKASKAVEKMKRERAIVIQQERGILEISDYVLSTIASKETAGVDGVASLGGSWIEGLMEFVTGERPHSGVRIRQARNEVELDLTIGILYGYRVPELANEIRNKVAEAVAAITGARVRAVNVTVDGIHEPPPKPAPKPKPPEPKRPPAEPKNP